MTNIVTYMTSHRGMVKVDTREPLQLSRDMSKYRFVGGVTAETLPVVAAALAGGWHANVGGLSISVEPLAKADRTYQYRVTAYQDGEQIGVRFVGVGVGRIIGS